MSCNNDELGTDSEGEGYANGANSQGLRHGFEMGGDQLHAWCLTKNYKKVKGRTNAIGEPRYKKQPQEPPYQFTKVSGMFPSDHAG